MIRKVAFIFAAALILLAAASAHAISLEFFQVDWLSDPGVYVSQNSDWGRVEVTLTAADDPLFFPIPLDDGTVGRGGYINIYTDAAGAGIFDREIYNLPIFYTDPLELDGRLPQGAMFDLGIPYGSGTNVPSLSYDFRIDPVPRLLADPLPALAPVPAMVGSFDFLTGGDLSYSFGVSSESGGAATPPAAKDLEAVKDGEKIGDRASISIPEKNVAPVNEGNDGCAPGSVARSIKYMGDANSNVNVPASAGTVYGELYGNMKTNNGKKGTYTSDILAGKNKYVSDHNLPIVSTQTKNFKKAMETLKDKGDVEIGIRWGTKPPPPPGGTALGAHRAFVSEMQEITDAAGNVTGYVVKTIDDPVQGDGTAANKSHTARFDANGKLVQYDGKDVTANGAGLINFQTEDVYASTVELEIFGLTVTCHVSPGGYVEIPTPIGGITTKIPLKRPGDTADVGVIKIRYMEGFSMNSQLIDSNLVALENPGVPPDNESNPTLDMNFDVDLTPPEMPGESTYVSGILNFEHEHALLEGLLGRIVPAVDGQEEVFLENFEMGDSFFDITYQLEIEGQAPQVCRLHGEVAEPFTESVWLEGAVPISLGAQHPDFAVDSFFDVWFDIKISPEAYPLLAEPGLVTLLNMSLSAVQLTDLIGDANYDGIVNELDASILADNWLLMDEATWEQGDFNGDGAVNEADVTLLAANWQGSGLPSDYVPEPAGLALLALGMLACLAGRFRGKR